jgi:hypothetical protein
MSDTYTSHSQVIEALGVKDLSTALGKEQSHIRTMKARNSIPFAFWPEVAKLARSKKLSGITEKVLKELVPDSVPRSPSKPATSKAEKPQRRSA